MMDYDKTPSSDTESIIVSDEDETIRKKPRSSFDDDEDSNETNLTNLWRKRRKLSSTMNNEITNLEQNNPSKILHQQFKHEVLRSNSTEYEKSSPQNYLPRKPHDHQVPNFAPTYQDDFMMSNRLIISEFNFLFLRLFFRASSFRHLPPKKQTLLTNRDHLHEQMYQTHSSSTNDLSSHDHYLRCKI